MANDERAATGGDAQGEPPGRKRPWQTWESLIEEQIKDAQQRGEFDNLRGRGKPLDLGDDTNDPTWMTNRMLRGAGFVPPALDLGRDIDDMRRTAEMMLDRVRRRRVHLLEGGTLTDDDRARFNAARTRAIDEHRATLKALNDRILALTLSAPAALHRRTIAVEAEIAAFERDCPPL